MKQRSKLGPIDYAVMIGGPTVFIVIAILGIRALIGGQSPNDPVKSLRDGVVSGGMSQSEVLKKVGLPKTTIDNPNGTTSFRYEHGTWDSERRTFIEEDGYVDFDESGRVSGVSFESKTPSPPR